MTDKGTKRTHKRPNDRFTIRSSKTKLLEQEQITTESVRYLAESVNLKSELLEDKNVIAMFTVLMWQAWMIQRRFCSYATKVKEES